MAITSDIALLLHFEGADTSQTFTDSSLTPKDVTAVGNAQIDTAQAKFGSSSGLFDGTGDYLTLDDSADWDVGTGAFTIDFWIRFNAIADGSRYVMFGRNSGATTGNIEIERYSDNKAYVTLQGNSNDFGTWKPSTGAWIHVAVTRDGSNLRLFINGTQLGSTATASDNVVGTTGIAIGAKSTGANPINGWLDEFRFIKGTALWTADFTPPTAPLVRVSSSVIFI